MASMEEMTRPLDHDFSNGSMPGAEVWKSKRLTPQHQLLRCAGILHGFDLVKPLCQPSAAAHKVAAEPEQCM